MPQEYKSAEPIKEYYIAYFDLLGYRKFFQNNPDKIADFLQIIHAAVSNTQNYIQEISSSFIGGNLGKLFIRTKVFSDNILLCLETDTSPIEYPRFLAFLTIVADIQRNYILQHGLFLRGGITIGKLSFNDDYIFGQGIIDAVELEETAKYPRIIIGQTIIDFVLQTHFVKQDDLQKACDIESRVHSGQHISDEELSFYNSIMPDVAKENFFLQLCNHLIFHMTDGTYILNYLYLSNINSLINPSTMKQVLDIIKTLLPNDYQKLNNINTDNKQLIEQHKSRIIQKIEEYGKYDDLNINDDKEAEMREHILKKYLWVLSFHNYICLIYGLPESYKIKSGSTCDIRFMRMRVEIFENNPSKE